jgi:tetratricopeptide (TPR) repeat protein
VTAEEIWAALADNAQAPDGPVRIARAEYLVDAADAAGEPELSAQALLELVRAYEYGSESPRLLVPFARLLRMWDADPRLFDARRRHKLFWYFKWATSGMVSVPEVPLASIEGWLEEMEERFRQAGYSPRPVHMGRHRLARAIGDTAAAEREFEAWLDADRDQMADCHACEAGDQGWWHATNGRDAMALDLWAPVLGGELACAEEPHRVLSTSLLPLLRLGRADEARANHLRGYRMARGVANLRSTIGRHIEFCALTGNEARGLEILTEHAGLLAGGTQAADSQLGFLIGAGILLRRLVALGFGGLEFPVQVLAQDRAARSAPTGPAAGGEAASATVALAAEIIETRIAALCARFDARNGNSTESQLTASRMGREPLVAALPLGSSAILPQPASAVPGAGAGDQASISTSDSLGDLVARARRLTLARDPRARDAWERVAASGFELAPVVAAHVERSRAHTLMDRDPEAARAALLAVAERFAGLGAAADAREARGNAAFAAFLAGDADVADTEVVLIGAEAETAYAAGELTARQYLTSRSLSAYLAFSAYSRHAESAAEPTEGATPDDGRGAEPADVTALLLAELELADRLGDPGRAGVYCRMLAQIALHSRDQDLAGSHLAAARERFLAGGQAWDAAESESVLAQLAMQSGRFGAAEQHARDALAHGEGMIGPEPEARLGSLLVDSLARQPDRELDLVSAALRAAQRWEGLSEPDTLHNRFTAARAYLTLERHGEAAALFGELMPHVHVPYDTAGIAMTREQYGDCLAALGEHQSAAEQYVAAAVLLQDDPQHGVAHARLGWSAAQALQNAGMEGEALHAYRRAAELWGALGHIPARVRCLRSAAWLVGQADGGSWTQALAQMRAVLAELEAVPEAQRTEQVRDEVEYTREQLGRMLERAG